MHDRLYRAVYAAIALHFARKIISRVSPVNPPGPAASRRMGPVLHLSPAEADRLRKELFSSLFADQGAAGIYQGLPKVRKSYPSAILAILNRDSYPI